jgi:polar amino acid transport system substrate-binding protein
MVQRRRMDRRSYLKTMGAAGGASFVAGCQDNGSENTIVPGTASGFFPFEFKQSGELVGFDIELTEEVIGRTEFEAAEWADTDFDSLPTLLTEGDIDFIAAPRVTTMTEDGRESITFTDPYYEPNQAVLVAEDGDFRPDAVNELSDMAVGARPSTWGMHQLEELLAEDTLSEDDINHYDDYTVAVRELENGDLDALVVDTATAENVDGTRAVTTAFIIQADEPFYFKMRQDDERIDAVNDAIAEVMEDGTYETLTNEWFTIDV